MIAIILHRRTLKCFAKTRHRNTAQIPICIAFFTDKLPCWKQLASKMNIHYVFIYFTSTSTSCYVASCYCRIGVDVHNGTFSCTNKEINWTIYDTRDIHQILTTLLRCLVYETQCNPINCSSYYMMTWLHIFITPSAVLPQSRDWNDNGNGDINYNGMHTFFECMIS